MDRSARRCRGVVKVEAVQHLSRGVVGVSGCCVVHCSPCLEQGVRSGLVVLFGTHEIGELHACCKLLAACMCSLQLLLRFCLASILAVRVVVGGCVEDVGCFCTMFCASTLWLDVLVITCRVWRLFRNGFSRAAAAV
jgi:hypothetical protein